MTTTPRNIAATLQATADQSARAVNAAAAGVAVTVEHDTDGFFYVIWTATSAGIRSARLYAPATTAERLAHHVAGFVANLQAGKPGRPTLEPLTARITSRTTEAEHAAYLALGGSAWLRRLLAAEAARMAADA